MTTLSPSPAPSRRMQRVRTHPSCRRSPSCYPARAWATGIRAWPRLTVCRPPPRHAHSESIASRGGVRPTPFVARPCHAPARHIRAEHEFSCHFAFGGALRLGTPMSACCRRLRLGTPGLARCPCLPCSRSRARHASCSEYATHAACRETRSLSFDRVNAWSSSCAAAGNVRATST